MNVTESSRIVQLQVHAYAFAFGGGGPLIRVFPSLRRSGSLHQNMHLGISPS